ncbi:hypothetical protein [Maribacter sp. ACAM166]|uniref:hypothetical protein n=1 Tax=Maribacter sp. ACAM166 TaxID=2508996 RepID=UPI0010FD7081|nr:hypothetical protein [Maribacter sp. ACAM166]TLP71927.1 hypothetical protein ES765_18900 [Maribacter sp. ACAM166]
MRILEVAGDIPLDSWMEKPFETALAYIQGVNVGQNTEGGTKIDLEGAAKKLFVNGEKIYNCEVFCVSCHQTNGKGLSTSQLPPLAKSPWVNSI